MLDKLLNRWHTTAAYRNYAMREPNERLVIALVAALVIGVLLWTLLWQPIARWSEAAQDKHQNEQTLNDWLVVNEKPARAAEGNPKRPGANGGEDLLTIVSRTADQSGLKLTRFQPESNGVSVVLQKQVFNDVLSWLNLLESQEQVLVVQASVDADSLSGRVNARFSLRR